MLTSTVCAAISAAGLGIALLTAYRRRFLAATRIAAWALIPIGLVLTGITDWLTDLVLKPTVWAGFGILALSAALFAISRAAGRRRSRRAVTAGAQPPAVAPAASAPAASGGTRQSGAAPAEDFSDIEAILKKHGI
ncbi:MULTISPECIES: hypothetical protein [Streptomyces]|uniref:Cellulose synthase n=1 Tax=Streptomyces luteosporeus TaxID=173856 RepID=A0ABN3TNN5_9ACTN